MELKHYVYVYLDPRKPGKYEYFENGVGISFDFEPFYIGEGQNGRMYEHLKEAKNDNFENVKGINKYKIRKIRKIWKAGLDPIIYKIFEFQNRQDTLDVERTLGFLIGRHDQKRGPLTNLVDCGGKSTNPSKETIDKIVVNRGKTLNDNPQIKIITQQTRRTTLLNNPDILIKSGIKISEAKQKFSSGKKASIEEKKNITLANDPSIRKNQDKKRNETKIKNRTHMGKNHQDYVKLDTEFIIKCYFTINNVEQIKSHYFKQFNKSIGRVVIKRFLKILNFPTNTTHWRKDKELYLKFVEENKNKIDWYIENYERLEEEYYNRVFENRYESYKL